MVWKKILTVFLVLFLVMGFSGSMILADNDQINYLEQNLDNLKGFYSNVEYQTGKLETQFSQLSGEENENKIQLMYTNTQLLKEKAEQIEETAFNKAEQVDTLKNNLRFISEEDAEKLAYLHSEFKQLSENAEDLVNDLETLENGLFVLLDVIETPDFESEVLTIEDQILSITSKLDSVEDTLKTQGKDLSFATAQFLKKSLGKIEYQITLLLEQINGNIDLFNELDDQNKVNVFEKLLGELGDQAERYSDLKEGISGFDFPPNNLNEVVNQVKDYYSSVKSDFNKIKNVVSEIDEEIDEDLAESLLDQIDDLMDNVDDLIDDVEDYQDEYMGNNAQADYLFNNILTDLKKFDTQLEDFVDIVEEHSGITTTVPAYKMLTLSDYPEMFIEDGKFNGYFVVGENSVSMNNLAMTEIAVSLDAQVSNTVKLDSEISDVNAQNLIVVGGPCVNTVAAELFGNPIDCTIGLEPGQAIIKLFQYNDKVAMVVAGYTDEDTRLAAKVLVNHKYDLYGTEMLIEGTSYEDVQIGPLNDNDEPLVLVISNLEVTPDPLVSNESVTVSYDITNMWKHDTYGNFVAQAVVCHPDGSDCHIPGGELVYSFPSMVTKHFEFEINLNELQTDVIDGKVKIMAAIAKKTEGKVTVVTAYGEVFDVTGNSNSNSTDTLTGNPTIDDTDGDGIVDALDNCKLSANVDQVDSDNDGLGDVCDGGSTPADNPTSENATDPDALGTEWEQYEEFDGEYEDFEDDYFYFKKKYEKAFNEDDDNDLDKYEDKLDKLDDDLKDLKDEVEDLIDVVEDSSLSDEEDLLDKLDTLEDDLKDLREKVGKVLSGEEDEEESYTFDNYYLPSSNNDEGSTVTIEQFEFPATNNVVNEPVTDTWGEMRLTALIIAGIIILLAIVIFLVALLIR
jgi:gas vesicle protein